MCRKRLYSFFKSDIDNVEYLPRIRRPRVFSYVAACIFLGEGSSITSCTSYTLGSSSNMRERGLVTKGKSETSSTSTFFWSTWEYERSTWGVQSWDSSYTSLVLPVYPTHNSLYSFVKESTSEVRTPAVSLFYLSSKYFNEYISAVSHLFECKRMVSS